MKWTVWSIVRWYEHRGRDVPTVSRVVACTASPRGGIGAGTSRDGAAKFQVTAALALGAAMQSPSLAGRARLRLARFLNDVHVPGQCQAY